MIKTKGFVVAIEPFHDQAAVLTLLTEQGFFVAFDGQFFAKYPSWYPFLKESCFDVVLTQGSESHRFYLKKLQLLYSAYFENESLALWMITQNYLALIAPHLESEPRLFQSIDFIFQKLCAVQQESSPLMPVYFAMTYMIYHGLDFLGQGSFIHHYQKTVENLPFFEQEQFHSCFTQKYLSQEHFQQVLLYLCQHWYTYLSPHTSLTICYQCWNSLKPS